MAVVPVAKVLFLCEEVDTEGGLRNLYGVFHGLHPDAYPHTQDAFRVFAQLGNGLGEVTVHIDIRRAADGLLVHASNVHRLRFVHRDQVLQLSVTFEGVRFPTAGVYLVELFCDNTWVGDVTLRLLEVGS